MDFLYGAAGGGVVGIIAVIFGLMLFSYFKRAVTERDMLQERRTSTIEIKLEEHIKSDRSGEIWSVLRSINGNIEKLLSQNQALLISDEAQRQQLVTLFNNHAELKLELKECKKEHK